MTALMIKLVWCKLRSLPKDDNGAAMLITLAVFLFLYIMCSATYAAGSAIHEKLQLQNACDAAAYSAAVVEADGLSRIATINRAMSWTYVQTTRMQMDYIVAKWLSLTKQRFEEDDRQCSDFNSSPTTNDVYLGNVKWIERPCGEHCSGKSGSGRYFCGWTPSKPNMLRLGYATEKEADGLSDNYQYGALVSKNSIDSIVQSSSAHLQQLENGISNGKKTLELLNGMLNIIVSTLNDDIYLAASETLKDNLPKDYSGDEYRVKIVIPLFHYPYEETGDSINDEQDTRMTGVLSAYRNTEEDELEFLSASMQSSHLQEIFGDGIDQWFVRGTGNTFSKDAASIPINSLDEYGSRGIQRGYKSANWDIANSVTNILRGNHISYGYRFDSSILRSKNAIGWKTVPPYIRYFQRSPKTNAPTSDIIPSSVNAKAIFISQCDEVSDNFGLVSEYHWGAWKWWCKNKYIWTVIGHGRWGRPIWGWSFVGTEHYKNSPIETCSIHGNGDDSNSHSRANYNCCYVGADDVSTIFETHGATNGISGYMTMGYTRVYGDDAAIWNSKYYITTKVMPVKLNHHFYGDRIQVVVAKKQTNPFRWMLGLRADNTFLDRADEQGDTSYLTIFDPVKTTFFGNTWSLAISTATAAFNDGKYGSECYETKYRQTSSYEYDPILSGDSNDENTKVETQSPFIKLKIGGNVSNDKIATRYRIGCPHVAENNINARLKNSWNLCETDWNAVFLPTRYAYQGYHTSHDGQTIADNTALEYKRYTNRVGDMLSQMLPETKSSENTAMKFDVYKVQNGQLIQEQDRQQLDFLQFRFSYSNVTSSEVYQINQLSPYKIE